MFTTLLTLFIVGVVALILLGVALAVVGAFVGLAFTLLVKVVPILLVGYVALRLIAPKRRQLSAADEEWLRT